MASTTIDVDSAASEVCDLPCSSFRGIAIHKARTHKNVKEQNFTGTLAAEVVQVCKLVKQQELRPEITCEGEQLTTQEHLPFQVSGHHFHCERKTKI